MDASWVVGLLAAVPLSIIANLLTPNVQRWWAKTSAVRKFKRIQKLKAELAELTGEKPEESKDATPQSPVPSPLSYEFPIPQLECTHGSTDIRLVNYGRSSVIAFTLRNAELRYDSSVHMLKAELVFTPFRGEPLPKRQGIFTMKMQDEEDKEKWYFTPLTSISMGGVVYLLIVVKLENGTFHTLKYEKYNAVSDQQLQRGEWNVDVKLTADNAFLEGSFKLGLRPDGSVSLSPLVDIQTLQGKTPAKPRPSPKT